MIYSKRIRFGVIVAGMVFILISGCAGTETSRFYTLRSVALDDSKLPSCKPANDIAIGIGPVRMPDYLDRPEIVIRGKENEIIVAEFDRWAGQFKDSFLRVFSENLSEMLSTEKIALYPWRKTVPIDYQVEIDVIQFDGELHGDARLVAFWRLMNKKDNHLIVMRKSRFTEPVKEKSYSEIAAAYNRIIEDFSREIALVIKAIPEEAQ